MEELKTITLDKFLIYPMAFSHIQVFSLSKLLDYLEIARVQCAIDDKYIKQPLPFIHIKKKAALACSTVVGANKVRGLSNRH